MEEAVAVIAAHLGVVREDDINNMSIPFFNDVLAALGRRLNYETISNLYGNSFCKDAGKYIAEANPLVKHKKNQGFIDLLSKVKITKQTTKKETMAKVNESLGGDVSWAEGLLD